MRKYFESVQGKMMVKPIRVGQFIIASCFIFWISHVFAVGGIASNSDFDATKEIEDMRVKVLGGYVRITRHWTGTKWQWNQRWEEPKKETHLLLRRSKSPYVYSRTENGKLVFEDRTGNAILTDKWDFEPREAGYEYDDFTWRDKLGNKINFSRILRQNGSTTAIETRIKDYRDRNDVVVTIEHDADGFISEIKDHQGNVVVIYTWETIPNSQTKKRLIKIADYSGREVVYSYKDNQGDGIYLHLIDTVVDVRGETWKYEYTASHQLSMQRDPSERITRYEYDTKRKLQLNAIIFSNGNRLVYGSDYDQKTQLSYKSERYTSGKFIETWSNSLGKTVRKKVSGELEFSVEYELSNNTMDLQKVSYYFKRYADKPHINGANYANQTYCDLMGAVGVYGRYALQSQPPSVAECSYRRAAAYPAQSCGGNVGCKDNPAYLHAQRLDDIDPLLPRDPDPLDPPPYIKTKIVTDGRGNKTTHEYDQWGNEIKVIYADGAVVTRTWHAKFALPLTETNALGVTTEYQYDEKGNVLTFIEAKGTVDERTTRYTYDEHGQLKTKTTGESAANNTELATTAYEYDEYGNLTGIVDPLGKITIYSEFDVLGNAGAVTNAQANEGGPGQPYSWTQTFDAAGNMLTNMNPYGKGETYTYNKSGDLQTLTEANGSLTSIAHGLNGLPSTITNAADHSITLEYNKADLPTAITDPNGNVVRLLYDATGNLIRATDAENNITRFEYSNNVMEKIHYPSFNESISYDQRIRIKESTREANGKNYLRKTGYDLDNNLLDRTDANGNNEQYRYDKLGRLIEFSDAEGGFTTFTYDARDNLLEVEDPEGRLTVYRYDLNDQLISETKHDAFLADGDTTTQQRRYNYDANGNLISTINPAQEKTTYEYDQADRLIKTRVYASAASTQPIKIIQYNINAQNQFTGYSQQAGIDGEGSSVTGITPDIVRLSETYTYTALNQLETVTVNFGAFSKSYSYSYYPNGLKQTYTNPEGITYTYYYNKNNQLTAVHIPGNGQLTYSNFKWLAPQTLLLPGGNKITLSYNDFLQVQERILKDPADNNLASAIYEYDLENNINRITSELGSYSFDYDNLYRLTSADYPLNTAANDEAFAYDGVGNRMGHTLIENADTQSPNATTTELDYNDQNQMTQTDTATYTYNANGHTQTKTEDGEITEYIYNHEERLIAVKINTVTVGEYSYNPNGMRIKKTVNSQNIFYFYNDKGLAAEYDASGNLIKEYHFHPQKTWMTDPLFQRTADSQVYHYQNDHLGTPQRLIKSNGATVWSATYSAFGEAIVNLGSTIENNLRFPGQYFDSETGLHHNYFRDYDPNLGRYVQGDPIGLVGGINQYGYAHGNPVEFVDPTGKFFIPGAIVGAIIGGFSAALTVDPCLNGGQSAGTILSGIISGALSGGFPFGSAAASVWQGAASAAAGAIGSGVAAGEVDVAAVGTQAVVGAVAGVAARSIGFRVAKSVFRNGGRSDEALTAGGVFGTAAGSTAAGAVMVAVPRELGGAGAFSDPAKCGC